MADPTMLGNGLAANAAVLEKYRPAYTQMATEMMSNGQEPPSFPDWAMQQSQAATPDRRGMLEMLINKLKS